MQAGESKFIRTIKGKISWDGQEYRIKVRSSRRYFRGTVEKIRAR